MKAKLYYNKPTKVMLVTTIPLWLTIKVVGEEVI